MSEEKIERISVTATIEVGQDPAKVFVKRVDGESIELQTVMMLVIGKTMKEMADEIFVQDDEEDKS